MAGERQQQKAIEPHEASVDASFLSRNKASISHVVSGTTAGAAATMLLHPLDLVKTRLQVQDKNRPMYRGMLHAMQSILATRGVRGLYQGVSPNVAGNAVAWGSYFFGYNLIKDRMRRQGAAGTQLSHTQHLVAATAAGACTLVVTNPIWVVKTRMCLTVAPGHTEYRSLSHALRSILREEGLRGMYKGFLPGLVGTSHGGVQFMTYEAIKRYSNQFFGRKDDAHLSTMEYIFGASSSKVVAGAVTYPYQVVRSRLQSARQHHEVVPARTIIANVYRNNGIAGFFNGLFPYLVRVMPATCVTFVVYEQLSAFMKAKL